MTGQTPLSYINMEETFVPLRGIKNDLKGRLLCYKQDWTGGFRAGIRLVIFFILKIVIVVNIIISNFKLLRSSDDSHCSTQELFNFII